MKKLLLITILLSLFSCENPHFPSKVTSIEINEHSGNMKYRITLEGSGYYCHTNINYKIGDTIK